MSGKASERGGKAPWQGGPATIRLMTYNVHRCIGMDGKHVPQRIADIIARYAPDVIALQELETGHPRTQHTDQAKLLASLLNAEFHYHAARQRGLARFGNAILSRLPMRRIRGALLPTHPRMRLQSRGALWVAVTVAGQEVQIINTHLGLFHREQVLQAGELCGKGWLTHPECRDQPRILCGDFNSTSASLVYRLFMEELRDVRTLLPSRGGRTWPSFLPLFRYDHVFVGPKIQVKHILVPRTSLTRLASDHLPVVVDVRIDPPHLALGA